MIETVVIKLGGSVLYDANLNFNTKLVEKFANWFKNQVEYKKVVFVVGGGKLSRFLLGQVNEKIKVESQKHQIGIKVTQVNVSIVFSLFKNQEIKVFDNMEKLSNSMKNDNVKGAIIGGIKEGWSTDMVAAHLAKDLGVKEIYKVSNIDYIYSADPAIVNDAKPLKNLTWDEYIHLFKKQIGKKHEPGMNAPIDISCSVFCKENKIAFRVFGGDILESDWKFPELLSTGTLVL